MAKPKSSASKSAQHHPTGDVVTLTPDQRRTLRERREFKGWRQDHAAARIGVTPATISNMETGRSKQTKTSIYASYYRLLFGPDSEVDTASPYLATIVEESATLPEDQLRVIADLIRSLKKK